MTLRSALDALAAAISPGGIILNRSVETGQWYVLAEDRRQNGRSFERVGISDSLEAAALTCLDRWNRATPVQVWEDPEG